MTINAEDFGVVGDGERHNTLELIALRDHIRDGPDRVWQVEFEPGHYAYEDERWLSFGGRTVVLEFNNSTVECKARPLLPLATNTISFDNEFPAKHAFNKAAGLLIESVEVNATEAKLAQPAPGHFLPGEAVLAAGRIQQFNSDGTKGNGWPPNFRYFEWKLVRDMPDEQTVRFVDPFRFSYDAAWPDFLHDNTPYGAPRLFRCLLGDGRRINRSLTIRNARFIKGRSQVEERSALGLNGLHIRLENCTTADDVNCWPTVAKRVELVGCRLGSMEMDKIVESVLLDGCEVYRGLSSGGAGVLDVRIKDTSLYGFVQATPRRSWIMDNSHAYGGVMLSKGLTNTPLTLSGTASGM